MSHYHIRPFNFTDSDYEAVVALQNLVQPNRPNSVVSWRHWLTKNGFQCVCSGDWGQVH
jgi:hypothetical protein